MWPLRCQNDYPAMVKTLMERFQNQFQTSKLDLDFDFGTNNETRSHRPSAGLVSKTHVSNPEASKNYESNASHELRGHRCNPVPV
jgi:hypothetical protein